MIQAKSILTYSNGIWGAGSAPQLDSTNAGQKLLFIHALEDKNYEINGSFVATVGNGKNSRLEELPYALIDVTADNTSDLNTALANSTILTTKETEEQFLNNFHQKKYRFSVKPYESIGPVTPPAQTQTSSVAPILQPSDLKPGQWSWIGGKTGGALVLAYCPTDEELNNLPSYGNISYADQYANMLALEQQVISDASLVNNADYTFTTPRGELTSTLQSTMKPALFSRPIFAYLPAVYLEREIYPHHPTHPGLALCTQEGVMPLAHYIDNQEWTTVGLSDGQILSNDKQVVLYEDFQIFGQPPIDSAGNPLIGDHATQVGKWNPNDSTLYYYAGLTATEKANAPANATLQLTWDLPYKAS